MTLSGDACKRYAGALALLRAAKGEVMRKPQGLGRTDIWPKLPYVRQDLELALLRQVIGTLETLSNQGIGADKRDVAEMHRLLLLLEVSQMSGSVPASTPSSAVPETLRSPSRIDWSRLLPLLLAVGVVLGVIIAQLLGLDMRRAF